METCHQYEVTLFKGQKTLFDLYYMHFYNDVSHFERNISLFQQRIFDKLRFTFSECRDNLTILEVF